MLYQLSYTHQKNPAMLKNQPAVVKSNLARQEGFEPSAYGLEVRCSIQLSYWRAADGSGTVGPSWQAAFLACVPRICK